MPTNLSIIHSLAIIALTALTQAGFQLGISLLIVSASSTNRRKGKKQNTLKRTTGIFFGYSLMAWLAIINLVFIAFSFCDSQTRSDSLVWLLICGLNVGVALAVWLFYFRKNRGTTLWLPRNIAHYLTTQTSQSLSFTTNFMLGIAGFFGESLFLLAPLSLGSFVISALPKSWNLIGILLYGFVSTIPIAIIWGAINSGQHISYLQKWREDNKLFLQFAIGASLIVLSLFVFINYILFDKIVFG